MPLDRVVMCFIYKIVVPVLVILLSVYLRIGFFLICFSFVISDENRKKSSWWSKKRERSHGDGKRGASGSSTGMCVNNWSDDVCEQLVRWCVLVLSLIWRKSVDWSDSARSRHWKCFTHADLLLWLSCVASATIHFCLAVNAFRKGKIYIFL